MIFFDSIKVETFKPAIIHKINDKDVIIKIKPEIEKMFNSFGFVKVKTNTPDCYWDLEECFFNKKLNYNVSVCYYDKPNSKYCYIMIATYPFSYEKTSFGNYYSVNFHINQMKRDFRKKLYQHRAWLQGSSKETKQFYFKIDDVQPSVLEAVQPVLVRLNTMQSTGLKWIDRVKSFVSKMVKV